MKRVAFVLSFLLMFLISCTHEYPYTVYSRPGTDVFKAKMAVLPFFSTPREVGVLASDLVSQHLINNGLRIVDRSYLGNILQEQEFSLTGLTKNIDLQKVGKLVDADYLITGAVILETKIESSGMGLGKLSFSGVERKEFISAITIRISSVETGEVVKGASYALERKRGGEPDTFHARPLATVCETLVREMLGKKEPAKSP